MRERMNNQTKKVFWFTADFAKESEEAQALLAGKHLLFEAVDADKGYKMKFTTRLCKVEELEDRVRISLEIDENQIKV